MPDWGEELSRRLQGAGLRGDAEADVIEELTQHLEDRYAELRARNVDDAEARRLALEELEEEGVLAREVKSARRARPEPVASGADAAGWLGGLGGDVRHAARVLRRAPAFTLIAAAVIALGIGANTAIFSVINAVLLRPHPGVEAPHELATIHTSDYSGPRFGASSYPDFEAMRESGAFAGVAAHTPRPFSVMIGESAVKVLGEAVSADFFSVLGVTPARGRFFGSDEAGADGTSSVVVISDQLWRERFGGASDIVGRAVRVNGTAVTIIGVAPPEFRGMMRGIRMDVWVPLSAPESLAGVAQAQRGNRGLFVVGRLRDDTPIGTVQARMNGLAAQLYAEYPQLWGDISNRGRSITVLPESESRVMQQMRGPVIGMLTALMVVVAIVLLIACSNVANLMLTRASARTAEMGLRLALGATRGRIVRQLLTESVLLAALGGAAGVLLAFWLTRAVNTIRLPLPVSLALDVSLDARVLAFAAAITVLTGVLFGVVPALRSSRAPAPMMKGGATARRRTRLRSALVVVQVAASLMLLAVGGLFLRSLAAAQQIDTGIAVENMLLAPFDLAAEGYAPEAAQQLVGSMVESARALPGVTAVVVAERVPLGFEWSRRGIVVGDYQPAEGEDMELGYNGVGPGYFDAMGIRMLRGRGFTERDRAGAPEVVVVNEAFARRYWPGRDAIGMRIGLNGADQPFAEVVGVVPDGKYRSLTEEPIPYFYYPYLQRPSPRVTLHVRTAIDPAAVLPSLRSGIRSLAPSLAVPELITLGSHLGIATLPQRIGGIVLAVLGALALLIAGIGLYGVIAYTVAQRTREFGIRAALGAAAGDVQAMVVRQGVGLALIGVAIGLALALGLGWAMRGLLFVSPFDPVALGSVVALLTGTAALASWIPARRAARKDPLIAIRSEV